MRASRTIHVLIAVMLMLVVLVAASACASDDATNGGNGDQGTTNGSDTGDSGTDGDTADEPDPVLALVETKCSMCHTLDRVWEADYDQAGWEDTVDRMKQNGLVVTDEEYEQIVDYLAAN